MSRLFHQSFQVNELSQKKKKKKESNCGYRCRFDRAKKFCVLFTEKKLRKPKRGRWAKIEKNDRKIEKRAS